MDISQDHHYASGPMGSHGHPPYIPFAAQDGDGAVGRHGRADGILWVPALKPNHGHWHHIADKLVNRLIF